MEAPAPSALSRMAHWGKVTFERARTVGATGRFQIRRLPPGVDVTGRLAREAGEGINDESFFVTFPYQDGTPYWLDTEARPLAVPTRGTVALGDIAVTVHGR